MRASARSALTAAIAHPRRASPAVKRSQAAARRHLTPEARAGILGRLDPRALGWPAPAAQRLRLALVGARFTNRLLPSTLFPHRPLSLWTGRRFCFAAPSLTDRAQLPNGHTPACRSATQPHDAETARDNGGARSEAHRQRCSVEHVPEPRPIAEAPQLHPHGRAVGAVPRARTHSARRRASRAG
jgi:hypothetical protein